MSEQENVQVQDDEQVQASSCKGEGCRVEFHYEFAKAEEHPDYTFILGPVLVPEKVDRQGDVISADVIEKAAHDYMEDSQRPGLMHQLMLGTRDARVVESFIARTNMKMGGRTIKKGTWMVAMRVYNEELRKMIRAGKFTGFSIGGHGTGTPA